MPMAKIDIPIIVSSNPKVVNILSELSKNIFPPIKMPINENKRIT